MALCDIDIDVNCDECYEVSRTDSDLNFIYGLTPSTQYYLWVIDKFRNVYRNLFTSGVDGSFDITLSNYPNGMFNKYAGVFELFISTDVDGVDIVPLTIYATEYNYILLSITSSTEIRCETPNINNCLPVIVNDYGTLIEVDCGDEYTCQPQPCEDATYTIKDSANTTLYSGSIASGSDLQQTVSDSEVTVNGNAYASVKATDSLDVAVEYENGTPVGTIVSGVVEIPNPVTPSGIAYQRPKLTGQLTSYRTGDDAWRQINRPYNPAPTNPTHIATLVDNVTLAQNNAFGNTFRFTDQAGNKAFNYPILSNADILTTNTAIDHYTGLEWGVRNAQSGNNKDWETAIDECLALNVQGFDDWYLPNTQEWLSVADFNGNGLGFNVIFALGSRVHWSSTTDFGDTTYATTLNIAISTSSMINRHTKVTNRNYLPVRQRY